MDLSVERKMGLVIVTPECGPPSPCFLPTVGGKSWWSLGERIEAGLVQLMICVLFGVCDSQVDVGFKGTAGLSVA